MVTIRYENPQSNFITNPFELGIRHLKVAFSDGSQNTLTQMAKERIIYRPSAWNNNEYKPLTWKDRSYHAIVGLSETLGYVTLITPFIASIFDRIFNKPFYPKGGDYLRSHMEEGGDFNELDAEKYRVNPFDQGAAFDPFYCEASWLPAKESYSIGSLIGFLIAKADKYDGDRRFPQPLHDYLIDIINKPDFQKDPQAYMENWKIERGFTEEYRFPEDKAACILGDAIRKFKFISPLIAQAEIYAKDHCFITPFSSKEESSKDLFNYIKNIIDDPEFQKDRQAYLENMKQERGKAENIIIPVDQAIAFFEQVLIQPQS